MKFVTISSLLFLLAFGLICNAENSDCNVSVLDIVFVLDESGSVGQADYNKAKNFLIQLVTNFNVNPNKIHVGMVRYSTDAYMSRTLVESDQDKNDLLRYLQSMSYMGGLTATGDALDRAKQIFTRFGRVYTPRIVIVLTDGYSNSGSINVNTAAAALKAEKVHIFAVGIGPSINDNELTYMASEPKDRYKKLLSDYNQLVTSINEITNTVCGTNAIVVLGEKAVIKTAQNELRKFETDISKLKNTKYLELSIKYIKGYSSVGYSFTNPNPIPIKASIDTIISNHEEPTPTRVEIDANNIRTIYYDIPIPTGSKLFYFSVKSIAAGDNEYELQIN